MSLYNNCLGISCRVVWRWNVQPEKSACHEMADPRNYDKQPNIRYAFGDPLYRWSFASAAGFPDQEARWLYEK